MSDQASNARPSPYRGILPFRYADRENFFGREREISELVAKILNYRLVVLFGDSGAGKSSLINAGVVPRLESEGFQPERLRVRPFKENPFLVERIASGRQDSRFLPSVFAEFAQGGSSDSREVYCSLEQFEKALSHADPERPLVLVLDQFEELFTLFEAADRDLRGRILAFIANAANRKDLAAKIVLGIREDFLGKLELISKEYPQVFDRRVRLDLLGPEAAKRAVVGPFERKGGFPAEISAETADAIIEEFGHATDQVGIHPTQLQIVCSRLWNEYSEKHPVVTRDHFLAMKGVKGILEGFLESTVAALSPGQKDLAYGVLGQLITTSGTRDVVSDAKLKAWYAQAAVGDDKALAQVLGFLDEQRLINRTSQHDLFYSEVSSEYLVNPIKEYNRVRECKDAERKAAEAAASEANEAARVRELDQAHRLAAEKTRVAEAERQRAEYVARSAKRSKFWSKVFAGLTLICVALTVVCVLTIVSLTKQREIAKAATNRAELEKNRANDEAQLANARAAELEQAKSILEENLREARATSMRITELMAAVSSRTTKRPIDSLTGDMQIKEDALSRDPERLKNALANHPSPVAFDVEMRPLQVDPKLGQLYRFELFPQGNTVEGGMNGVAMITMLLDSPSFKKSIISAGPKEEFKCTYEGWGCLDDVVAVIEYREPSRRAEVTIIRMCDIVMKKYGRMQKR